jgi:hypothetical protein
MWGVTKLPEAIAAVVLIALSIFVFSGMGIACVYKMVVASLFTFLILSAMKLIEWGDGGIYLELSPEMDLEQVSEELTYHLNNRGKNRETNN